MSPTGAREGPAYPPAPPMAPVAGPPRRWPELAPARPAPPARAGLAWTMALVLAVSGAVAAGAGAFAPWARYADGATLTGVQHGDGRLVLVVAAATAVLAVAVWFPEWRVRARAGLFGASVVMYLLYGLNRYDLARSQDQLTGEPIALGGGLVALAAGATIVLVAALTLRPPERGEDREPGRAA